MEVVAASCNRDDATRYGGGFALCVNDARAQRLNGEDCVLPGPGSLHQAAAGAMGAGTWLSAAYLAKVGLTVNDTSAAAGVE